MPQKIRIVKNRSDIGAGTRGSDLGIDAIEIAAINKGNDYFNRYPFVDVPSHNETIYDKVRNSFAKRIGHVLEQCERVALSVTHVLRDEELPIVLSGDHSSALGTISGIKTAFRDKRLGVVWIDAHADLHSPYTSPSGNIHGMPLAAALGEDNLGFAINEVTGNTEKNWRAMKLMSTGGAKVLAEDIVFFGVRDTEEPEDKQIEKLGIRNYKVAEIRHRDLDVCAQEAIQSLASCDMIYISFDVDSMDCDLVSRGTGTPVPKGFDPEEVVGIIEAFIDTQKVICLEIVEINPLLDLHGNKMAETAFRVLEAVTKRLVKQEALIQKP